MSPRTFRVVRRAALGVLVILIALAAWFGWQAYVVYRGVSNITGRPVPRATNEPTSTLPTFGGTRRVNFLLLGSDNDQKKEEAAPLTQSMIVATVDPVHKTVGLLSIPRDFYVPVPGHGYNKIDLAFKYGYQRGGMSGGIALARQTVERLFHIEIDYYGWVGLQGFSRVIDTFGGVTLDVQHPVLDDTYPNDIHSPDPYGMRRLFIPAGWQHMDGPSALEYVRSRHGDIHGDFGRSERQQQVLLQTRQKIQKIHTTDILSKLSEVVTDLENSVQTDLTLQQLYQLDQLSHQIKKQNIQRLVLQAPTYCSYGETADLQSILVPKWKTIRPRVRAMFAPVRVPRPTVTAAPTSTPRRSTPTPGPSRTPLPTATPRPTVAPTPTPAAIEHLPASLLYVRDGDIYGLDRSGATTRLTYSHDAAMPEISPDGKTIAFVRFTNGLHKFDKYASDIWLMDLATRRQHKITADESSESANNLWAAWPSWSSDGRRLLFASDRGKLQQPVSDARAIDLGIWSMPVKGGNPDQQTTPRNGAGGDTDPSWRPGSGQFLFVSWAYPSLASRRPASQLVIKDSVTGRVTPLTPLSQRVLQPTWSPDGKRVALIRSALNGGADDLVVSDVKPSATGPRLVHQRVLVSGHLGQPAFTPDGRSLSFLRADGDEITLLVVPSAGGQPRQVTAVQGPIDARWRPVWSR